MNKRITYLSLALLMSFGIGKIAQARLVRVFNKSNQDVYFLVDKNRKNKTLKQASKLKKGGADRSLVYDFVDGAVWWTYIPKGTKKLKNLEKANWYITPISRLRRVEILDGGKYNRRKKGEARVTTNLQADLLVRLPRKTIKEMGTDFADLGLQKIIQMLNNKDITINNKGEVRFSTTSPFFKTTR